MAEVDAPTTAKPPTETGVGLTDQTNLLPFRQVLLVFMSLALCSLVSALDSVIVATALPTISAHFHAGAVSSWVPSAYLITSTACQPLYGRFSDIFGRKVMLCVAVAIYIVGSLAAGFSTSIVEVIAWRAVAGAGGGGVQSLAQIIMSDVVSLRDRRGKYQGIIGGFIALGYAVGPPIGGGLAQKVSWRWCFWITLPLAFVAILVVIFVLPLKSVSGDMKQKLGVIDYLGSLLALCACTLVILPIIWGGVTYPWASAHVLAPLLVGLFAMGLFCIWEWLGAKLPIVPMYIFKHMTVTGVYITMFINGFIFFSSLYYLPQFFQVVLGYSPVYSGTFLLPVLVTQTVASFATGMTVSRTGKYRTIVHLGFTVWAVGCGCLSTVTVTTKKPLLVLYMVLAGIGAGGTLQTTTVAAQASVSRKDMSVVTAVRNFVRLLGGTLSLAIGSTVINNTFRASMTALSLPPDVVSAIIAEPGLLRASSTLSSLTPAQAAYILSRGYTRGFRNLFILNAALSSVAVVASVFMIRAKELTRGDEEKYRAEAKSRLKAERSGKAKEDATETAGGQNDMGDIEMGIGPGIGDAVEKQAALHP
ncbi:hypothetical protein PLICRDRAFT_112038 [Plicaturopsis crispa FD-325 SS-3]|nr:hypothetical protein PLICRDRAFT_112038 [Plicaturopsis crispa FD-325 SS-3]